jgi:sterol desaturase/sphingolipid hydroxylase (fatty acid hydroxylase superfamily)
VPDLIHFAIPFFVALIAIEAIFDALMRRELYQLKDTTASLTMGIGNVLVNLIGKVMVFGIFSFVHRFAFFKLNAASPWTWLALFFADDFTYYWYHRVSHQCRLFWASHVVHHSSQKYNLGTALRQTWTGTFFGFIFYLWMPLIGFTPMMILTMQAISLIYQFWIHTEVIRTMGPLEYIFNTPSHHRVHHASNGRYLDRNHGAALIIWDKLFGTFEHEDSKEPPVYGLTKNIHTYNPVRIALHEWCDIVRDIRRSQNWREALSYIFRGPGWKPEPCPTDGIWSPRGSSTQIRPRKPMHKSAPLTTRT